LKKYYHLEELKELFAFSESDVDYLVAESDVQFCLYCKTTKVIIGGWKGGKFIGFGEAKYSGLISMNANQQRELFEKKKLSLKQSELLQKSKVFGYKITYPFKVSLPNTVIDEWIEKPIDKIDWSYLPFRFFPEERKSNLKMFEGLVEQLGAITKVKVIDKYSGDSVSSPLVTVKKELFYHWKHFNLDDVYILVDEVKKAQKFMSITEGVVNNSIPIELAPLELNKGTKTRTDDFNDLLIEIIKAKPKKTAKEYWRIIVEEASELEGYRIFDKNNLIRSISENDAIEWVDKKSRPRRSISFGSFSNRVTRMNKLIYEK
jgi:hypothetical protein